MREKDLLPVKEVGNSNNDSRVGPPLVNLSFHVSRIVIVKSVRAVPRVKASSQSFSTIQKDAKTEGCDHTVKEGMFWARRIGFFLSFRK